jgi:hypothetical protein
MSNHDRAGSRSPDGDTALDRAWQQASDERPPPQLDAAIIAAARKSIQSRDEQSQVIRASPRYRSWLTRWQPLAAAATVAGLAFMLVQSLPRDRDVAPSMRMKEPVTTPAAPASTIDKQAAADSTTAMRATEVDQRRGLAPPGAADRAAGVAALYATGDIAGAADALREFRAAVADADTYLPESLRDWARTVE